MSRFAALEDRDWLATAYLTKDTATIALELGCSASTVLRARHRHGLELRPLLPGQVPVTEHRAPFTQAGAPLRQSLLRTFDCCPLAAKWDAEPGPEYSTPEQALGTVFHAVAETMLATMRQTGEERIPTQEAVEIMYEVLTKPETPHLADRQMRDLLIMVLNFTAQRWTPSRLLAIEQRLMVEVPCPDGVTRTLTGQPDVLAADPPDGLVIVDFKTGWAKPPEPRDGDFTREGGRPYLSERGVFQLDCYGFMALSALPSADRVTLREFHARWGLVREASLHREDLEHVQRRLGVLLMGLERTLAGQDEARPRPGSWCKPICPRISECPIPREQRRVGQIEDPEHAREVAERYVVLDGQRERDNAALKTWHEATGQNVEVADAYVGWRVKEDGKRSFGVHTVPSVEPEPVDLIAALTAAASNGA